VVGRHVDRDRFLADQERPQAAEILAAERGVTFERRRRVK
jgi:hypothetical protein